MPAVPGDAFSTGASMVLVVAFTFDAEAPAFVDIDALRSRAVSRFLWTRHRNLTWEKIATIRM